MFWFNLLLDRVELGMEVMERKFQRSKGEKKKQSKWGRILVHWKFRHISFSTIKMRSFPVWLINPSVLIDFLSVHHLYEPPHAHCLPTVPASAINLSVLASQAVHFISHLIKSSPWFLLLSFIPVSCQKCVKGFHTAASVTKLSTIDLRFLFSW